MSATAKDGSSTVLYTNTIQGPSTPPNDAFDLTIEKDL